MNGGVSACVKLKEIKRLVLGLCLPLLKRRLRPRMVSLRPNHQTES